MKIMIINPNSDSEMTDFIRNSAEEYANGEFDIVCKSTPGASSFIGSYEDIAQSIPGMIKLVSENEDEMDVLDRLKKTGELNGVPDLEIHEKSIIKQKEPYVSCYAGLWVPTAGIIQPYEFTITMAENAALNQVEFLYLRRD